MKINIDYWRSILSLAKISEKPGSAENNAAPFRNLVPGQQVSGEVLARLSDQVHLVKIAGGIFRTELPQPLPPGTTLTLTFRSNDPRPEFSMQRAASGPTPVKFSPVTTWLSETIGKPQQHLKAWSNVNLEPLLGATAGNTAALANSLRNALAYSGIFYESHLAQWVQGERLIKDIEKESSFRRACLAKDTKEPKAGKNILEKLGLVPGETVPPNTEPGAEEETVAPHRLPSLTDPHLTPLVREQLETLLSGIFRWQGPAWQDQEMEWAVEKHEKDCNQAQEHSWRTTIRMQLPNLGTIDATLMITGEAIEGKITTDSPTTRKEMQNELKHFEHALAAAGLTLKDMVLADEEAG